MKASEARAIAAKVRETRKKKAEIAKKEWEQRNHKRKATLKANLLDWWQRKGFNNLQRHIKRAAEDGQVMISEVGRELPCEIVDCLRKDGYQVDFGVRATYIQDPCQGPTMHYFNIKW